MEHALALSTLADLQKTKKTMNVRWLAERLDRPDILGIARARPHPHKGHRINQSSREVIK